MLQKIRERIFPFLIALSALSISASAAFYSVTGLSMLFAGASVAVLIMASSLEVAKLVIASLLYQYWNKLNKILKIYLTIATVVLMLLTSAGIYGYLSNAYQTTANQSSIVDQKIQTLETKKGLYKDTRDNILKEKQSISELKGTLSTGSTTQSTDKRGNLVIRSNKANIEQLKSANQSDEKLTVKLDATNDSIFALENKILEVKTTSKAANELGPLKYLSNLTGQSMDKIINWFLLVIIFVFDPLAIALVIAANFAFFQLRRTPEYELTKEDKEWLEADLIEDEEPKSTGIPVMVDPKTGKFYYEETHPEPKNLDLDGDGVIEEEELQQVFDETDTNNDGVIDDEEAKVANLDHETAQKLNQFNESIQRLENVTNSFTSAEYGKKVEALEEVKKLKDLFLKQFTSKKDDDNTITYF
jgi:hypothetical protein